MIYLQYSIHYLVPIYNSAIMHNKVDHQRYTKQHMLSHNQQLSILSAKLIDYLMQNSILSYQQAKLQRTKFIVTFQQNLRQLVKHLSNPQTISLKLYQCIVQNCQSVSNESFLCVSLCQMYITLQACTWSTPSSGLKWRERFRQLTEAIKQHIGDKQKENSLTRDLYFTFTHHTSYSQIRQKFNYFFMLNSYHIYNRFQVIWKLIIFDFYYAQFLQLHTEERPPELFIEGFKLFVVKKQQQLCNGHTIQLRIKQKELMKDVVKQAVIEKRSVVGSKNRQRKSITLNQQQPKYRYNMTIKEIMIAQINLQTIGLVQGCQAHKCPYIIFLIPFAYLLAETLTYYSNQQSLYIYRIFTYLCLTINNIKNGPNPQLTPTEINDSIAELINFKQLKGKYLCDKLGTFVNKHHLKMSTFIPFYYQIFYFHAFQKYVFIQQLFAMTASIQQRRKKMKSRVEQVYEKCRKYNSE